MAASSVQSFGAPGRGPIGSVSFLGLLPISDLIGGAVLEPLQNLESSRAALAARACWHCRGGAGWAGVNLQGLTWQVAADGGHRRHIPDGWFRGRGGAGGA